VWGRGPEAEDTVFVGHCGRAAVRRHHRAASNGFAVVVGRHLAVDDGGGLPGLRGKAASRMMCIRRVLSHRERIKVRYCLHRKYNKKNMPSYYFSRFLIKGIPEQLHIRRRHAIWGMHGFLLSLPRCSPWEEIVIILPK
jgi:hypothetical protein